MEEKINVEIDRLLEYIGEGATLDTKNTFTRCIGSIIANIIMGERFVIKVPTRHTFNPFSYQFENDTKFGNLRRISGEMLKLFGHSISILLNTFPFFKHVPLFDHFNYDILRRTETEISVPMQYAIWCDLC